MSGIFALYDKMGRADLAAVEERVKTFQLPGSAPHRLECLRVGSSLIGRYHLDVFPQPKIASRGATGSIIVTSGYRAGEYPTNPDPTNINSGFDDKTLQFIDRVVAEKNTGVFADFDGAFQILHCDKSGSGFTIMVDRYGLQPLYYYDGPENTAFAAEFALLFKLIGHTPDLDRESLAEFFEIGFVTGDRTLFAGVRVFPPASIATLDQGKLYFQRLWRPVFADGRRPFNAGETAEALDAALRKSVKQRLGLAPQCTVPLSGGLDSRLLLAAAVREGFSVSAYTFGPEGSNEFAIAEAVARRLDVSHARFVDTPRGIVEICEDVIRKTGGQINILDLGGMAHLPEVARGAPVVLNGYGGNELLGFLAFDLLRFVLPRNRDYIGKWLAAKLNPGWRPAEIESIRHALAPGAPAFSERVKESLAGFPAKSPIPLVYHFFLEEKARRANLQGVMADSLFVEPVAPFYGNEVVDLALTIPPRQRLLARFYRRYVISAFYPAMAEIEYSRSGLPANASMLRIAWRKLRHRRRPSQDPDAPWDSCLRGELREYLADHLQVGRPRIFDILGAEPIKRAITGFQMDRDRSARIVGQLLATELFLRIFY